MLIHASAQIEPNFIFIYNYYYIHSYYFLFVRALECSLFLAGCIMVLVLCKHIFLLLPVAILCAIDFVW